MLTARGHCRNLYSHKGFYQKMRESLKYSGLLLILFLLACCTGIILKSKYNIDFTDSDLILLSFSFLTSTQISLIIFFRGLRKENREQVLSTLLSISLKFLLELFIALIWFVLAKKTSQTMVILFFVLYLSFSMFLIITMLKTLKNKPL